MKSLVAQFLLPCTRCEAVSIIGGQQQLRILALAPTAGYKRQRSLSLPESSTHLIRMAPTTANSNNRLIRGATVAPAPFSTAVASDTKKVDGAVLQKRQYSTLPKLAIPPLKLTMDRFLRVAQAVIPDNELQRTKSLVDKFLEPGGEGDQLQSILENRAKQQENWLADWWLQTAYLEGRLPLPVNVSPGVLFPKQNYSGINGQLDFATKLIITLLKYKKLIDRKEIPLDMSGTKPMDMSQYDLLFGTTRIAGPRHDSMRYGCNEIIPPKHIVVIHNGKLWKLQVLDNNGNTIDLLLLREHLERLVSRSQNPSAFPLGIVTSEERSTWGKMYQRLKGNKLNAESFEEIERALFIVCIDQPPRKPIDGYTERDEAGNQSLHGSGSKYNSANRWFDKCLQFFVGADGNCGLTYEHSPADGPPVASLMDFVMDNLSTAESHLGSTANISTPERLHFSFGDAEKKTIQGALHHADSVASDVELKIVTFDKFGKDVPKAHKLSPDAFIQLAFQLAYFKLHKSYAPCYETGTLRQFRLGRTETIRQPSIESVAFVKAMSSPSESSQRKAELLKIAAEAHKEYTFAAMNGRGIDRHLLGLKLAAIESGRNVPKLLMDSTYRTLSHFQLSTSQVPTKHDIAMCFGPMYPDCYGICYNPQDNRINFSISAFFSFPETSAQKFTSTLYESLLEMKSALESANPKAKL